jgi:hypothetical protein
LVADSSWLVVVYLVRKVTCLYCCLVKKFHMNLYTFCSAGDVGCRIVKDAICFHGACFQQVVEKLVLDLHEPPMSQVNLFITKYFVVTDL